MQDLPVIKDREMRGPGRPANGVGDDEGEKMVKIAVTVFTDQAELAEQVGGGNRSKGFRYLAEYYRLMALSTNTDGMTD